MKFLLILSLFSSSALAEPVQATALQPSFRCLRTGQSPYILRYGARKMYEMVDFEFTNSEFTDPLLGCLRWVEELNQQQWFKSEKKHVRVRRLASPSEITRARLMGRSVRDKIYTFCQMSASCRIPFPYNLHWSAIRGYLNRQVDSPFYSAGNKCQTEAVIPERRLLSSLDLDSKILPTINIDHFFLSPLTNLRPEIIDLISRHEDGIILISAMIASVGEMDKVIEAAKKKPNLKIFVLVNFVQTAAEPLLGKFLSQFNGNVYLIPVFTHPGFRGSYHFKGATHLSKSGDYVFTSINYNSQDNAGEIDLGFSGTDPSFGNGLAQLLASQAMESCEKLPYLSCSVDLRFHPTHPYRFSFLKAMNRSCEAISQNASTILAYRNRQNNPLLYTLGADVSKVAADLIQSASNTIDISSHHMGNPAVMSAITHAKKKGVTVRLFVGRHLFGETEQGEQLSALSSYSYFYPNSYPLSHSKGILIDEKKLMLGTGNFTNSSLEEGKEYYFITEDPKLLSAFKGLVNTLSHFNADPIPYRVQLPELRQENADWKSRAIVYSLSQSIKDSKAIEGHATPRRTDLWIAKAATSQCLKKKFNVFLHTPTALSDCESPQIVH